MIAARRTFAVLLALLLVPVFLAALAAGRVNATVLNHDYVKQQLRGLDVYRRLSTEAMPTLVDDFLANQRTKMPENLRGVDLPTDSASRDRLVKVLQTALPPAYVQSETEQAIDALLPWVAGSADHFTIDLSLKQNVIDVFGHSPTGSVFEQAWLDLGMSNRVLGSLMRDYEAKPGSPRVSAVLGPISPAMTKWFDGQIFGAVDSMLPYLVGNQPGFTATISFKAFPLLAGPLAPALRAEPDELLVRGYVFTDADLKRQLGGAESAALNKVDNTLAIFRDRGYRWTDEDLRTSLGKRGAGDEEIDPLAVRRVLVGSHALAVWGLPLIAAALVTGAGFLGGRRWGSRVAWGAAALLVASAAAFILATAVYDATIGHALSTWGAQQHAARGGPLPAALRIDVVDAVQRMANEAATHAASTARNWLIASMLVLAGVLAWPHRERVGRPRAASDGGPPEAPPHAPPLA